MLQGAATCKSPTRSNLTNYWGFKLVTRELLSQLSFQDETISARLGAKVGTEQMVALDVAYDAATKRPDSQAA
jgi:hypothetical protein